MRRSWSASAVFLVFFKHSKSACLLETALQAAGKLSPSEVWGSAGGCIQMMWGRGAFPKDEACRILQFPRPVSNSQAEVTEGGLGEVDIVQDLCRVHTTSE